MYKPNILYVVKITDILPNKKKYIIQENWYAVSYIKTANCAFTVIKKIPNERWRRISFPILNFFGCVFIYVEILIWTFSIMTCNEPNDHHKTYYFFLHKQNAYIKYHFTSMWQLIIFFFTSKMHILNTISQACDKIVRTPA